MTEASSHTRFASPAGQHAQTSAWRVSQTLEMPAVSGRIRFSFWGSWR